ncbi:MAG TPA: diguanylate cyclase [Bacillota bacterium]|nr:diguanylate cyclase [Bacillota bacterium]
MSNVSQIVFTTVPLIAFVANVFLLFTLLSAKKDVSIYSFMGLLFSFVLWTGGSFFMRMQFMPGVVFWWKVSLTGIFLVPYMYYLLIAAYTERKGMFLRTLWGIVTLLMVVGNFLDVFMTSPQISLVDDRIQSEYSLKWPAAIAVVFSVLILISVGVMIRNAMKDDESWLAYMMPMFIGVFVMLIGVGLNMIPAMTSWPTDTLACAINAIFIYFAFYKRRFYSINQITSRGAVFIISLVVSGLLLRAYLPDMERFVISVNDGRLKNPTAFVSFMFVILCILLYILLNHLNDKLFEREQTRRDFQVKDFSKALSSILKTDEILSLLIEMIREELPVSHIYLCMENEDKGFSSNRKLQDLEYNLDLPEGHPLIEYAAGKPAGFAYEDFRRSACGKSLFESEKTLFARLGIEYILPFAENGNIIGLALLSGKDSHKPYSYSEINYLESLSSVAAIALRNALLYEELEREAQIDMLTGLLNRRTFGRRLSQMFDEDPDQITLILFNLDDFGLYNELYGNEEGDRLLQRFAEMLVTVFGPTAVLARYAGKEFIVLLPNLDAETARHQAERVRSLLDKYLIGDDRRAKKFLTFSAGICSYPSLAGSESQLLSYANLTVFHIKQQGKNNIAVYSEFDAGAMENDDKKAQELSSTIYALTAAIDAKDHYTFNHSRCVSEYASCLAQRAGLGDQMVQVVRQAGLLHDIGKIGIPDAILSKEGRLDEDELAVMREHVDLSIEMVRHLPALDYVTPAVMGHHERYDGKGYPRGISGEAIPIGARCLSIADAFDAMISERSYKNSMPVEDALLEIENNLGSQFDPRLGELFIKLVKEGEIKVIRY